MKTEGGVRGGNHHKNTEGYLMVFILGASGVMVAAIADKLTEDYGLPGVGIVLRGVMTVVVAGAIIWFLTSGAVVGFL